MVKILYDVNVGFSSHYIHNYPLSTFLCNSPAERLEKISKMMSGRGFFEFCRSQRREDNRTSTLSTGAMAQTEDKAAG